MSELYRKTEIMFPFKKYLRLFLVLIIAGSIVLTGCSYIPWVGNDDDDLAFEEDFPFEEEEKTASGSSEDDFFEDDSQSSEDDSEFGENDGFASIDQQSDKNELEGDVGTLQTQQEALISKVRELEETLASLGPKINATQEQLEGSLSAVTGNSEFLEPEV